MRHRPAAILAACLILSAAHSSHAQDYQVGDIQIDRPWTRATPPMANVAGGYMTLHNDGAGADRLTGGSSPLAERVEIHLMEMDGDVMRMRHMPEGLEIPAGGEAEFAPGGFHLMLVGLKKPVAVGERVPVTLQFEMAGSIEIEMTAEAMGASAGGHGAHGGH